MTHQPDQQEHEFVSIDNLVHILARGHSYYKTHDGYGEPFKGGFRGRELGYESPDELQAVIHETLSAENCESIRTPDNSKVMVYNPETEQLVIFNLNTQGPNQDGDMVWDGGTTYQVEAEQWSHYIRCINFDWGRNVNHRDIGPGYVKRNLEFYMRELENAPQMDEYKAVASGHGLKSAPERIKNDENDIDNSDEKPAPFPEQEETGIESTTLYEAVRHLPILLGESIPEEFADLLQAHQQIIADTQRLPALKQEIEANLKDPARFEKLRSGEDHLMRQQKQLEDAMTRDTTGNAVKQHSERHSKIVTALVNKRAEAETLVIDTDLHIALHEEEADIKDRIQENAQMIALKIEGLTETVGIDDELEALDRKVRIGQGAGKVFAASVISAIVVSLSGLSNDAQAYTIPSDTGQTVSTSASLSLAGEAGNAAPSRLITRSYNETSAGDDDTQPLSGPAASEPDQTNGANGGNEPKSKTANISKPN